MMEIDEALQIKYATLSKFLDERAYRLCLAGDAIFFGRGGVSRVSRASGASRSTIYQGIRDLQSEAVPASAHRAIPNSRIRNAGGGRKPSSESDETLVPDLDALLDPLARSNPTSPLRWTSKSTGTLAMELRAMGHTVSQATVWRLLDELGYSMQSNRKASEESDHPDRNTQFAFINSTAQEFIVQQLPVISVDTKKKKLIGPGKNTRQERQSEGEAAENDRHDAPDQASGEGVPHGVFAIGRTEGWVSVGITRDTAPLAVESIRRWWYQMGRTVYPDVRKILIMADGGGNNSSHVRLWKVELQRLADELGMEFHVRHFPPGISKWDRIAQRMCCHITENWRGRPLIRRMAVVELLAAKRTTQGLVLHADLDDSTYETGRSISDDVMNSLAISTCAFHGEWNYSIEPRENVD